MASGRRILLLADDSPATQKVVSLTFADEGLEVVAVGDGSEAARRLDEGLTPDIVLADIFMPGLSGYELCERIKGDSRLGHVPVLLLVGTFEPYDEVEARRVGADTVLTKPFQSIRDLVSKVGSLLGGSKPESETEAAPAAEAPPRQDAEASFADIQMDDEMIEARPAANYEKPDVHAPASATAEAPSEFAAPEAPPVSAEAEAAPAHVEAETAHDLFADTIREPFVAASHDMKEQYDTPSPAESTQFAQSPVAEESRVAQPAFAARMAGAAAADDALLDLDIEPPASTSEADDFILDLGDDEPAFREAAPAQTPPSYVAEAVEVEAHAPDAPGAFAEAAHGASAQDYSGEAVPHFGGEVASEVVAQDAPQHFGSYAADEAMSAPRGFVEPEVVPAEGQTPAFGAAEFTDGSVEGDVAKPPAAGFVEPVVQPIVEATPAPSTEGFEMGAARAGVEESVRPDQLSPEVLDAIARRVIELMSNKVVREIAWEVVPELAERLIRQKMDEDARKQ